MLRVRPDQESLRGSVLAGAVGRRGRIGIGAVAGVITGADIALASDLEPGDAVGVHAAHH